MIEIDGDWGKSSCDITLAKKGKQRISNQKLPLFYPRPLKGSLEKSTYEFVTGCCKNLEVFEKSCKDLILITRGFNPG